MNFSTINDDIQMKDVSQYKQSIRRQRKYYETFNSSLPDKLSNFNLCSDRKKKMKLYSSDNTTTISVSTSLTTPEVETDNAIIDMEREREMVEQYYKERNVLLTKAMFG